jgi:hypothetical protein
MQVFIDFFLRDEDWGPVARMGYGMLRKCAYFGFCNLLQKHQIRWEEYFSAG